MKTTRKRSQVWNLFTLSDENTSRARCNYCKCSLSFKGGSTRNLLRHVTKKHPHIQNSGLLVSAHSPQKDFSVTEERIMDEPIISVETDNVAVKEPAEEEINLVPTFSSKTAKFNIREHFKKSLSTQKSKDLDAQLIKMICKEYHPFSLVENNEFKQFVNMLNSSYMLPSKKILSTRLIPQTFERVKFNVKQALESTKVVSLTTDGWTSVHNQAYITITAHYISNDCKIVSHLLECFECSNEKQTADYISMELNRIVHEWDIDEKICAIVTNNSEHIVGAVHKTKWLHIPCFAHIINLIVQKGLKSIEEVRLKIKSIVNFFKRNQFAMNKLLFVQEQLQGTQIKPVQDVATRWISTYNMMQSILDIQEPLLLTLIELNSNLIPPNEDEFVIIQKACEVLRVFAEVADEVSSDKHVFLSKVVLLTKAINQYLEKQCNQNDVPAHIRSMIFSLQREFSSKFSDLENDSLYAEAMFLDPRFKKHSFTNDNFSKTMESLSSTASKILMENNPNDYDNDNPQPSTSRDVTTQSLIWDEFDSDVEISATQNPIEAGIQEVEKYISEPYIDRKSDPLKWWENRQFLYPALFEIMKRRLCIPATSAPCEWIFSEAGQVINLKRNRLSQQQISTLLFLNSNL